METRMGYAAARYFDLAAHDQCHAALKRDDARLWDDPRFGLGRERRAADLAEARLARRSARAWRVAARIAARRGR